MSDTDPNTRWTLVSARDVMRTNVVTVSYAAPLSEVERLLVENQISGMPVTDAAGNVIGVVSLKDLVERYQEDPDSRPRRGHGYYHLSSEELNEVDFDSFDLPEESEDTAESIMTAEVYSVGPDAGLREIARVMAEHRIHRVLVTDNARCVGLISTLEILDALAA
jgi:CBS domain-containing protein